MCMVFGIVILINYKYVFQTQFLLNFYLFFHLKTINLHHNCRKRFVKDSMCRSFKKIKIRCLRYFFLLCPGYKDAYHIYI